MADPNATGFDIDKAEEEYQAARGEGEPAPGADDAAAADDAPPGFLSFEEYVGQGGDPEMYRGRKAYETEHERINENKRLRKDIKGFQRTVQQTMDAVTGWQNTEREKMRAELDADLHKAKEDEDVNAAIDAQKKIDQIEAQPAAEVPAEEHSVIQDFRADHPELDRDGDDFNEEFNADVEAYYNLIWQQLSQGGRRVLTDGQIKRCLRKALKDAVDLHGDDAPGRAAAVQADDDDAPPAGESPRNKRRTTGAARRRSSREPPRATAENFVIENPRNRSQKNAAVDVRDRIHKAAYDGAKKAGMTEADATKRADEASQRFEASLAT